MSGPDVCEHGNPGDRPCAQCVADAPRVSDLEIAARFALRECEEITRCYNNTGDFWGLADNAARELRAVLNGGKVSPFARSIEEAELNRVASQGEKPK